MVFRKNSEAFVPTSESGFVDFSAHNPLVEFAKENIRYRGIMSIEDALLHRPF